MEAGAVIGQVEPVWTSSIWLNQCRAAPPRLAAEFEPLQTNCQAAPVGGGVF